MKLTIFAATGGIGRHVVDQAVAGGHDVTAVARNPRDLPAQARLVTADLSAPDPAMLEAAVGGADAVLSGLGPRSRADSGITSRGTGPILDAMRISGVRRIVVVSAAPVGTVASPGQPHPPRHDPGEGLLMRYVMTPAVKWVLREHYQDLALMEDMLRDSGLDWTAVRPPRLTNSPETREYRTAYGRNLPGGTVISRADVAHAMLWALEQPESIGKTLGVAR
ncbi:NAD(P)-dependent oxidoreductase [Nocardioides sp. NPDC051685]|uniref:NAD(P)-dependent oxidoreductase n=1 Tax=Nocardioides sp. NPDC051685 TaxID=3364334 RepID=UPI00378BF167